MPRYADTTYRFTCPIIVDGVVLCEFEAAADIRCVSEGRPARYTPPPGEPAAAPEWEVGKMYVDLGCYVENRWVDVCAPPAQARRQWAERLREAPDWARPFIMAYLEKDGAGIIEAMAEAA